MSWALRWELGLVLKKPSFSEGARTHKCPVINRAARFWIYVNGAYRIE